MIKGKLSADYDIKQLGAYSCETKSFIIGNLDMRVKKLEQENESLRLQIKQLKFGIESQVQNDIQRSRQIIEQLPPRGRGRPKRNQYVSYGEARIWAQEQSITTRDMWRTRAKSRKHFPRNIPRDPEYFYRASGWDNWGKFLGKQTLEEKERMINEGVAIIMNRAMDKEDNNNNKQPEAKQQPELELEQEVTIRNGNH